MKKILSNLPGAGIEYGSIDTVEEAEGTDVSLHPVEYLNTLNPNGMPPHMLLYIYVGVCESDGTYTNDDTDDDTDEEWEDATDGQSGIGS